MNKFNIEIIECYHITYPAINTCVGSDIGEQSEITVQSLEHTHAFFHYVYIQKCDQGKIVIAHEEYPLTVGHIYMVKPNTLHLIKAENCELLEQKFNTNDSELLSILNNLPAACELPECVPLLTVVLEECKEQFFKDSLAFLKVYELILMLNREASNNHNIPKSGKKNISSAQDRFLILIDFISKNYSNDLDIQTMADFMHMEKGYFSKQFKKAFNITPMNYLNLVRIQNSLNLLEYTDLSIDRISEQMGFSCQNSYQKAFKKQFEITPRQYREKIKQEFKNKYNHL